MGKYLSTLAKFPEGRIEILLTDCLPILRPSRLTSPEGVDTLGLHDPGAAVHDTLVRPVQTALLDHLVLVLDQELDPLDGGSHGLGDPGSHSGQHEVLKEPELLSVTHSEALLVCPGPGNIRVEILTWSCGLHRARLLETTRDYERLLRGPSLEIQESTV